MERHQARPSNGRDPGFALNGLYSPFRSWGALVKTWREAKDNQAKLKSFTQQGLGEAWKVTGDAPDHQKLFDSRAKYAWRQVPPGALLITGACDVQGDRLEWAVYAFGANLSSWLIDKGVIEGDPNGAEVWSELDKVFARTWQDQHGKPWSLDAFGVDAGYLSNRVYGWTRRYVHTRKVFALKGVPGWAAPPIGAPGKVDVDYAGKRIGSTLSWPVGTWNQKSEIYHGITLLMAWAGQGDGPLCTRHRFLRRHLRPVLLRTVDRRTGRDAQGQEERRDRNGLGSGHGPPQ
jgi:phage terminase large subunit GpA-like protein